MHLAVVGGDGLNEVIPSDLTAHLTLNADGLLAVLNLGQGTLWARLLAKGSPSVTLVRLGELLRVVVRTQEWNLALMVRHSLLDFLDDLEFVSWLFLE